MTNSAAFSLLQVGFAERIESVLRQSMGLAEDEAVEEEPEIIEDESEDKTEEVKDADDDKATVDEEHVEL